ncbi:MAG: CDP-diacylglycerol--glycerol-3-phosphate 3-phosphatidyltransferase [Pirellulaceae bacterium]
MNDATTVSAKPSTLSERGLFNVPNQLTIARLVLALICFVALVAAWYGTALVLFLLAVGTDWIDGFWARRYGQITQLGRILDPFADKIVICGTFIFLAAVPQSRIAAWMAVLIVARELLVTGLRSFFEQQDIDFSAQWSGKWKMAFQCLAAGLSLYLLTYYDPKAEAWHTMAPGWLVIAVIASVWLAVLSTIYSGWVYVRRAWQLLVRLADG